MEVYKNILEYYGVILLFDLLLILERRRNSDFQWTIAQKNSLIALLFLLSIWKQSKFLRKSLIVTYGMHLTRGMKWHLIICTEPMCTSFSSLVVSTPVIPVWWKIAYRISLFIWEKREDLLVKWPISKAIYLNLSNGK